MPSEHVAAWHLPARQDSLPQSALPLQLLPALQRGQALPLPPQSRSDSAPFCTPSVQLGAAHTLFVHMPVTQSPALLQLEPSEHLSGQSPPQSVSDSVPFRSSSVHEAAAHVPAFVQLPPAQSEASLHARSVPHLGHVTPPQSTSVSAPFF